MPIDNIEQEKRKLRQKILAIRSSLTESQRLDAAHGLAQQLIHSKLLDKAQHIAAYKSYPSELNLQPVIEWIWQQQKNLYLPVITDHNLHHMQFCACENTTELKPNKLGIAEPQDTMLIEAEQLNVVLMPLLAFDQQGHRLGLGGGYYDRFFAYKLSRPSSQPKLLGVAFDEQQVLHLNIDSWDVPLDGIITPSKIIKLYP